MEVHLAGTNLDRELIAALRAGGAVDPDALTPETLSAAYARISRDPRPIPELRAEARRDVARARRSNERIVFGFGHASVAEHAVFNFDVLGISRLVFEALEATRLGSYTEKSQRYILLERDVHLPREIAGGPHEARFRDLLDQQRAAYEDAYARLRARYAAQHPADWQRRSGRAAWEGAAKEDARYFLSLATTGQVGATFNARSLEATVRRLAADPLAEARELGEKLHAAVAHVTPSLVRYTAPTPFRRDTPGALRACECPPTAKSETERERGSEEGMRPEPAPPAAPGNESDVRLLHVTPGAEEMLVAALLHGCSTRSWASAREAAARLDPDRRRALVLESLRRLDAHEPPLRAYELPVLRFELTVSASCFAQLKRHRLATLLPQSYDPSLGVTIPASFDAIGIVPRYRELCRAVEALWCDLGGEQAAAAAYALTNGHRRRVLFQANARELYHFSRLRLDAHAQWDIRAVATEMIRQARAALPLVMLLAAGKDGFADVRAEVFGGES